MERTMGLRLYCYAYERPKELEVFGHGSFYIYDHTREAADKQLKEFIDGLNEARGLNVQMPKFLRRQRW